MKFPPDRLLPLLAFYVLLSLPTNAQTGPHDYSVTNYNSDNALPQNSINDMAFDSNGFLWLATEMGMVRFDGQHFREYTMDNSPALYTIRCNLVRARKGKILIEPTYGSHRLLTVTDDYQLKADSRIAATPYQVNRWGCHLFYYNNIFKKWGASTELKELLYRLDINGDVVTENERQAYARKDANCYYLNETTAEVRLLKETAGHAFKMLFMVEDVCFYFDKQNRFYAYRQGRLQKNIHCSNRLMQIFNQAESGAYPTQYTVNALRDDHHTFLVYKGNILLLKIRNGLLDFEILAANTGIRNINCLIYNEAFRTLYAGTATSGLYIIRKHTFDRLFFDGDNYAINSLYAQVEIPAGRVLTGSGVLSPNNARNTPAPGLYDRPVLLQSTDGYIWYSNYDFLKKIDTGLRKPITVQNLHGVLAAITETHNKDLVYANANKLFRRRGNDTATLLHMPDTIIQVIKEIFPNDLWIGTSTGLYSYDLAKGTFRRLALQNASVRALYKAGDGSIWIGTYGQGFYKYDNGRFVKMPTDPGNNLATIHCFMEDKLGYFWLPTNKGLYRVAKKELDAYASGNRENIFYYYFDKSAGYSTNEFNGGCMPCGIVLRNGRFSLPSLDGLVQFRPDSIPLELPASPVFIERIIPEEKKVLAGDHFEQRQDSGPLLFMISSPYFGNPANLHLEYQIPQLDNKWRPVNSDGKLVLTGLKKGKYTLSIRKQEAYGRYAYNRTAWTILPYWYETVWFWIIVAIISISILLFIFLLLYTREVKRAAQLEQKVAERTEALTASNLVKEKMIAVILHDLRSPLRFLHIMADYIFDNYQKASRPHMTDMLLKFRNATNDLNDFTQDFLTWTNTQKEGFVIKRESIALKEAVAGIVSLYEPAATIRQNRVLNLVPPELFIITDLNILKLIIRNLVDNANKYTVNGEIRIEGMQTGNSTRIVITDTGKTMNEQLVADILNNTYTSAGENNGFGYRIILELLARIDGKLFIDQPEDISNRITLIFTTANDDNAGS